MSLDVISICLGILTVLIFMAAFTLLRTMHSPFIKRFEQVVKGEMKQMEKPEDSHSLSFKHGGKEYTLFEIKQKSLEEEKTVYNNFIFLKVHVSDGLTLKIVNPKLKNKVKDLLSNVLSPFNIEEDLRPVDLDGFLTGFEIETNNKEKASEFLKNKQVQKILSEYKTEFGYSGFVMPLFFNKDYVVLDYRLSAKCLDEIVNNPRNIKNHILVLGQLADNLE